MAKKGTKDTEKAPATVRVSKVKPHFNEEFARTMDASKTVQGRCATLLDLGVENVTIRQAAELCGLDAFTIRSKTQAKRQKDGSYKEPILSKTLVEGRVLISVSELASYDLTKGTRSTAGRRQYKVYMTAEEAADYELVHPDSRPRTANLSKAEKAAAAATS